MFNSYAWLPWCVYDLWNKWYIKYQNPKRTFLHAHVNLSFYKTNRLSDTKVLVKKRIEKLTQSNKKFNSRCMKIEINILTNIWKEGIQTSERIIPKTSTCKSYWFTRINAKHKEFYTDPKTYQYGMEWSFYVSFDMNNDKSCNNR